MPSKKIKILTNPVADKYSNNGGCGLKYNNAMAVGKWEYEVK